MHSFLFLCILAFLPLTLQAESVSTTGGEIRVLLVGNIETTLSSQINAEIRRMSVELGDRFKTGQVLVEFDCRLPHAHLDKAEAELQATRKTYAANVKLQEYQAISDLEVAMAEAAVLKAEAEVTWNKAQVSLCTVRAPFSGRVISLQVAQHASVNAGTPLLDIIDDSALDMQLHLPSMWLAHLKRGKTFKVRIDETGREYNAEIRHISAKIDPVSQTIEIKARIKDKDQALMAGMSGTAYFEFADTLPQSTNQ